MDRIEIVWAPDLHRYELRDAGKRIGMTLYRPQEKGEVYAFDHTEVHEGYSGLGLAGRLVQFALDDVRARGVKIRPYCPYVRAFLRRHPEYQDLVVEGFVSPED
ncbi:GNAT family N-acetyltransferase [Sinomonas sp. ASV322]|uniref:GNAT family N-acetyltransferase n=1 Tax=Sinomonas sp. ASV322 TaxID=3041920 RepID=UPI0027DB5F35|nr:GNAT family N-acetyltransferase [Sinomonas sp. ASV322]MDQ4501593.1 GNAT family N-acetyltransferase [Sinomonas sp. ASV322]